VMVDSLSSGSWYVVSAAGVEELLECMKIVAVELTSPLNPLPQHAWRSGARVAKSKKALRVPIPQLQHRPGRADGCWAIGYI
jgi:hypothetical protein